MRLLIALRAVPGGLVSVGLLLVAFLVSLGVLTSGLVATTDGNGTTGHSGGSLNTLNGKATVPAAGRAVDSSHPDHVIGSGTPASCTSAAVVRDVAAGGVIRFDCGPKPVTIVMTSTARVRESTRLVVIDGGDLVTLSGDGMRRILFSDTCNASTYPTNRDCLSQAYPSVVVQNITFKDGYDGTPQATCTANVPSCAYGGVDGGGAIYVEGGQFKTVDSRFVDNSCYASGPDLGGGAIRALAQYQDRPVYVTDDTFSGGRCSNGGALSSISVSWDIYDSKFTDNRAIGSGANPASPGTPGGGSGGAIYLDGRSYNALIAGTSMEHNSAREGGGAVFEVIDDGTGTLTFEASVLRDNASAGFQTAPGVFYQVDGQDKSAQTIP